MIPELTVRRTGESVVQANGGRNSRGVVTAPLFLFVGLAMVLVGGCGSAQINGFVPAGDRPLGTGAFQAGAAKADLTPPPGFPTGGYSLAGSVARGHWGRLYARAIYLEDPNGSNLALVACDLWAVPAGLVDRVAELLGKDDDRQRARGQPTRFVGRSRLLVAATHTHHSPAAFATSPLYNAGAGVVGGFDPDLFEFLASRIADAVVRARNAATNCTLSFAESRVAGLARNRSFEPFSRNPDAPDVIDASHGLSTTGPTSADYPFPLAYRAVDPGVRVLTARDPAGQVVAAAAFVATHPTTVVAHTPLYTAELFGAAATLAEQGLTREANSEGSNVGPSGGFSRRPPVVAVFNGPEGDVSAAWAQQDRATTLKLGRLMSDAILRSVRSPGTPAAGPIDGRFAIVPVAASLYTDAQGVAHRTATAASPGVAFAGGAEDGRSGFYALGFREGVRSSGRSIDQGSKRGVVDCCGLRFTELALRQSPPPREVPLAVYKIGPIALATLPGEFTTVMGRRIRQAVIEKLQYPPKDVLLVGLANEYLSYFTTPEEYDAQHYEGASTYYGPYAGPLIGQELAGLAASMGRSAMPPELGRSFCYDAGSRSSFGVHSMWLPNNPVADLGAVLQDEAGAPAPAAPTFEWSDSGRRLAGVEPQALVVPAVSIEIQGPNGNWSPLIVDGVSEDDSGLNFVTLVTGRTPGHSRWRSYWLPPLTADRTATYRFAVNTIGETSGASTKRSTPFQIPPALHGRPSNSSIGALATGQSVTVTVCARPLWSDTGVELVVGGEYELIVAGEQYWHDASIKSDADGVGSTLLQWPFEWARRAPGEDWFTLMGSLDHSEAEVFRIGTHRIYTATSSGKLTCFANDVKFAYFNNSGKLRLTIIRRR